MRKGRGGGPGDAWNHFFFFFFGKKKRDGETESKVGPCFDLFVPFIPCYTLSHWNAPLSLPLLSISYSGHMHWKPQPVSLFVRRRTKEGESQQFPRRTNPNILLQILKKVTRGGWEVGEKLLTGACRSLFLLNEA